jgi:large subunit ribosomal protein L6
MSRIGKKPITVPSGVKVRHDKASRTVNVEGPKGKLAFSYRPEINVALEDGDKSVVCTIDPARTEEREVRAFWGTTRARIQLMMTGVAQGYSKALEVVGVGWNAKVQGKNLVLSLGYADPVTMPIPDGVTVTVDAGTKIALSGPDKQVVGAFASNIRSQRKPEPYNGKGVKYADEVIQRKQGKAFGS